MTHIVEVDQSIRIENTQENTVVAFANGIAFSMLISARTKRECLDILRMRYRKLRQPYLKLFCAALFLLLRKHITQIHLIVIDTEYYGHDGEIRGMLLNYLRRIVPDFPKDAIIFKQIGKRSSAHHKAYDTHVGKLMPDYVVETKELVAVLNQ